MAVAVEQAGGGGMIDINIARQLGDRTIAAHIATDRPIVGLFGPSGVGKTSILNMVAGLVKPDRGRIVIQDSILFDGERDIDLPPWQRGCGFIFQGGRLFPHRRVRGNLFYSKRDGSGPDAEAVIDLLGIGHLLDRWPSSLSGGEAQRVAIGRALLSAPRILLMDEPLTHLDQARKDDLLALILRIQQQTRIPILYVTHDARELDRLGADVFSIDF